MSKTETEQLRHFCSFTIYDFMKDTLHPKG